mmetsp:Transcript_71624/g.207401  ORF Transcript_71624/g.207401 Transcript_71624/m.207401 type:complete len:233 (-) Transcript_71624:890-1588(-)
MVVVALPTRDAVAALPHEARGVVHHLVGNLLPEQRVRGVGEDPDGGELRHGPPLTTRTTSALAVLAAVVFVLEAVLHARGGTPERLLLVAGVSVALPRRGDVGHPSLHSGGGLLLRCLFHGRRRRRSRRGPPLVACRRRRGRRGPPLVARGGSCGGWRRRLSLPRLARLAGRRRRRPARGQARDREVADHCRTGVSPRASLLAADRPVHPSHVFRGVAPVSDPQAHAMTHGC